MGGDALGDNVKGMLNNNATSAILALNQSHLE